MMLIVRFCRSFPFLTKSKCVVFETVAESLEELEVLMSFCQNLLALCTLASFGFDDSKKGSEMFDPAHRNVM